MRKLVTVATIAVAALSIAGCSKSDNTTVVDNGAMTDMNATDMESTTNDMTAIDSTADANMAMDNTTDSNMSSDNMAMNSSNAM